MFPGGFEQDARAKDVRAYESGRIGDASINMALGGEIQNSVKARTIKQLFQQSEIRDIALHESVSTFEVRFQVFGFGSAARTRVGKRIEVEYGYFRLVTQHKSDEITANKPAIPPVTRIFIDVLFSTYTQPSVIVEEEIPGDRQDILRIDLELLLLDTFPLEN
jgi:hypothetical protein